MELNHINQYHFIIIKKKNQFNQHQFIISQIEYLPYHTMATSKYKDLGIPYRLENVKAMDKAKCEELEKKLI